MHHFKAAIATTILGLLGALYIGGVEATVIVAVLSVLEISLSFDNAVVNAKILAGMDAVWRRRFILWGMPIAVFGMRLIFPLIIVAIVASITPWGALDMAVNDPDLYKSKLTSAHVSIMGFGGMFLWMVALRFFIDEAKDVHWIGFIERRLTTLGKIEAIQAAIALIIAYAAYSKILVTHGQVGASVFMTSAIFGLIAYIAADGLGALIGDGAARTGLAGFVYLELLDASFSFDGVIGAFALTDNLFVIAIGLGVGAMFVRSLTLLLVDRGTLAKMVYLEHGAFYAILALATIMFVNPIYEVPEVVTGTIGVGLILISLACSLYKNRLHRS